MLDYDARKQSELVRTLSVYLEQGGNYNATAKALVVHRSTLKYRLQRIRELSGHEGEMLLNGAYLVAAAKVERLRELVQQLGERHHDLDVRIELTGPWPPYNFVSGRSPAEPAPA